MTYIKKIFTFFLALIFLCGCGAKNETVSLEKDGTLYQAGNGISFYYPSKYELQKNQTGEVVQFKGDTGLLFYSVIDNEFDNTVSELQVLFKAELEENNASAIQVKEPALNSGLKCYEYSGEYSKTGIKFMYLVYFDVEYTYVYGYEANVEDYDKDINRIIIFIESFSKTAGI